MRRKIEKWYSQNCEQIQDVSQRSNWSESGWMWWCQWIVWLVNIFREVQAFQRCRLQKLLLFDWWNQFYEINCEFNSIFTFIISHDALLLRLPLIITKMWFYILFKFAFFVYEFVSLVKYDINIESLIISWFKNNWIQHFNPFSNTIKLYFCRTMVKMITWKKLVSIKTRFNSILFFL